MHSNQFPLMLPLQEDAADANSVKPQMFKGLVGRGHPEFSSNRQQVCAWAGMRFWHAPTGRAASCGSHAHPT